MECEDGGGTMAASLVGSSPDSVRGRLNRSSAPPSDFRLPCLGIVDGRECCPEAMGWPAQSAGRNTVDHRGMCCYGVTAGRRPR